MIDRILIGYTLIVAMSGLYLTAPEQSEPERQYEQYCDMVEAWNDTDGEHGWPPYKGDCDDE